MKKCLVTKLNDIVNNNSLLKVGEMRIIFNKIDSFSSVSQSVILKANKDISLEIIGDGYFTDSSLSNNLGKTTLVSANVLTTIYVSNSDCQLSISDKYSIRIIEVNSSTKNKIIQIDDLKYSTKMSFMTLRNSCELSGDISTISNMTNLEGILFSKANNIYGDIFAFHNLENLYSILVYESSLVGDIANLPKVFKGNNIRIITGKQIYGDIDVVKNYSNITSFVVTGNLTGDLATMPASLNYFQANIESHFTWTNRPSSSKIISISICNIDNIDSMLINQAECQNSDSDIKIISVIGTRTSASDAAVATLQSKGYTVSITNA